MKSKLTYKIILLLLVMFAILSFFYSTNVQSINTQSIFSEPSLSHFFGTDSLGRDLFWRVGEALFYSLLIGVVSSFLTLMIGVSIGAFVGYKGGWLDTVFMRVVEVLFMIPQFLLVSVVYVVISASRDVAIQNSILMLIISMSLCSWFNESVSVRNLVHKTKIEPYVLAATAIGAGTWRILWSHILKNIFSHIKILFIIQLSHMMVFESFLSFLGIGLKPPIATFGVLAYEGWQNFLIHPYGLIFPSLILFLVIFSIQNMIE